MAALTGFERSDGRWGFRDHVLVLPTHAAACHSARVIAESLGGVTFQHNWEWLSDDPDTGRVRSVFAGFASHPNVRATLLVGIDEDPDWVMDSVPSGTDAIVTATMVRSGGEADVIRDGTAQLARLLERKPSATRRPAPMSAMCLGLECGGSDALSGITANPALGLASDAIVAEGGTTILAEITEIIGAEHLLAQRARTPEVAGRVLEVVGRFEADIARFGVDFRGSQPTPGNIEGGLTTIEEKSLGAAMKGGSATLSDVLEYAQPPQVNGLQLMDTPGQDIEQMVGMVAAGANLVAFTSGRGTPTGSPIAPCLKIATHTEVFDRLRDLFDVNAGVAIDGEQTLVDAGNNILAALVETANGAPTASERRGNHEFAVSRIAQDRYLRSQAELENFV